MELTSTSAPGTSIAAFAAAVRALLDDLPVEEADDLVDGLEADLADQASDRGDDFVLADPAVYAAELRAAAGIPPRAEKAAAKARFTAQLGQRMSRVWRSSVARVRANRAGAWIIDLLVALRPVWWLARGWAVYAIVAPFFGSHMLTPHPDVLRANLGGVVLLAAFVLISIQWGRGRWVPWTWVRVIRIIVSVVTALALPFLVVNTMTAARMWQEYAGTVVEYSPVPGLAVDGERVRNVFAYDAEGNPLEGVQLFDQNGRPLTTVGTQYVDPMAPWDEYFFGGGGPLPVPFTAPGRQPLWNVYPLDEISAPSWDRPDPETALVPAFPFERVPSVEGVLPSPAPSETPAPSATPGPSGTPGPSATPVPSATPDPSATPVTSETAP